MGSLQCSAQGPDSVNIFGGRIRLCNTETPKRRVQLPRIHADIHLTQKQIISYPFILLHGDTQNTFFPILGKHTTRIHFLYKMKQLLFHYIDIFLCGNCKGKSSAKRILLFCLFNICCLELEKGILCLNMIKNHIS